MRIIEKIILIALLLLLAACSQAEALVGGGTRTLTPTFVLKLPTLYPTDTPTPICGVVSFMARTFARQPAHRQPRGCVGRPPRSPAPGTSAFQTRLGTR